jgi:hypothetical protein
VKRHMAPAVMTPVLAAVTLLLVTVTGCGSVERGLTETGGAAFSGPIAAPGVAALRTAPPLTAGTTGPLTAGTTARTAASTASRTAVNTASRTAVKSSAAAPPPQVATTCVKPLRPRHAQVCQTVRHDRIRPEGHPPALPAGGPRLDAGQAGGPVGVRCPPPHDPHGHQPARDGQAPDRRGTRLLRRHLRPALTRGIRVHRRRPQRRLRGTG